MSESTESHSMDTAVAVAEKGRAARISMFAAVGLTIFKLVVGLMTGSLGILSEAAHSGLDLLAAGMTYFAVSVSDRPADGTHHYGHSKVENLSALAETLLLLLTCVWIIYEAIRRLFVAHVQVEATPAAFGVMILSIVVAAINSRILRRTAIKHNSQALEADALHFSTDIWSSAVVVGGLALVWLDGYLFHTVWLAKSDAIAALAVAAIVLWVSLQLGMRTVSALLDTAPQEKITRSIMAAAAMVPGVLGIGRMRVRQSGANTFVDMNISVPRTATLYEAHQVAAEAEQRIRETVGQVDVIVHIDPVARPGESVPETIHAVAARFGLGVHSLHVHRLSSGLHVELHTEVPAHLSLSEAHNLVTQMENALRAELGPATHIESHMEPMHAVPDAASLPAGKIAEVQKQVEQVCLGLLGQPGHHDLVVRSERGAISISLHVLVKGATPITEAHALSAALEECIRAQVSNVGQVLIHVEPADEPQ